MTSLLSRVRTPKTTQVHITWNGRPIVAYQGDTILTALLLVNDHVRVTFEGTPRAGFCLMGACQDCWVQTSQGQRLRACSTLVQPDMALVGSLPGELSCH